MTKKLDYIVSFIKQGSQLTFKGIDITIILKEGFKINLSVLEK